MTCDEMRANLNEAIEAKNLPKAYYALVPVERTFGRESPEYEHHSRRVRKLEAICTGEFEPAKCLASK